MGKIFRTAIIGAQVAFIVYGFVKKKPWKDSKSNLFKSLLVTGSSLFLLRKK